MNVRDKYIKNGEIRTVALSGAGYWVANNHLGFGSAELSYWCTADKLEDQLARQGWEPYRETKIGDKWKLGTVGVVKENEKKDGYYLQSGCSFFGSFCSLEELTKKLNFAGYKKVEEEHKVGDEWESQLGRGQIIVNGFGYALRYSILGIYTRHSLTIEYLVKELILSGWRKVSQWEGVVFKNNETAGTVTVKKSKGLWYTIFPQGDIHLSIQRLDLLLGKLDLLGFKKVESPYQFIDKGFNPCSEIELPVVYGYKKHDKFFQVNPRVWAFINERGNGWYLVELENPSKVFLQSTTLEGLGYLIKKANWQPLDREKMETKIEIVDQTINDEYPIKPKTVYKKDKQYIMVMGTTTVARYELLNLLTGNAFYQDTHPEDIITYLKGNGYILFKGIIKIEQ